jgi:hypothetical protein
VTRLGRGINICSYKSMLCLQAITHVGPNLFKTGLMAMICMITGGAINFVLFADKMSCNTAFRCMVCLPCLPLCVLVPQCTALQ